MPSMPPPAACFGSGLSAIIASVVMSEPATEAALQRGAHDLGRVEGIGGAVGQPKAVAIAVKNASGRRRWSKLDEWLAPRDSS